MPEEQLLFDFDSWAERYAATDPDDDGTYFIDRYNDDDDSAGEYVAEGFTNDAPILR